MEKANKDWRGQICFFFKERKTDKKVGKESRHKNENMPATKGWFVSKLKNYKI